MSSEIILKKRQDLINQCIKFEEDLKLIPHLTYKKWMHQDSETGNITNCYFDIKDEELINKIIKEEPDIDITHSLISSVAIRNDVTPNLYYEGDIVVATYNRNSKSYSKHIMPISRECKLADVHFHNKLLPSTHVHINCNISSNSSRKSIINIIQKLSTMSRLSVGLPG